MLTAGALATALAPLLAWWAPPIVRFVVALVAAIYLMKLLDLAVEMRRNGPLSRAALARFLKNPFLLVCRRDGVERQPSAATNRALFAGALASMAMSLLAIGLTFLMRWDRWPFLLEHAIKATGLLVLGVALLQVAATTTRMAGGYLPDPGVAPVDARTPAEFWRRYNRVVNEFLYADVFGPLDGRHHPVRGTLAAFAVSGLIHEYLFSLAVGRVQGLQLAFFLLQGLAVALTFRVRPSRRWTPAWIAGTLTFNLLTSVLFFLSVNEIVPIYSHLPEGLWMLTATGVPAP